MHMADALVSPAVGGTLWTAAAALIAWCGRVLKQRPDDKRAALMGVLGAFVFAAQMINVAIPGTGSSGHLGGGLLLAIILGPHAALLVIASVLIIQSLFFMDGGLLALGANIINMGFFSAMVAYPLVYRPLAGKSTKKTRLWIAAVFAAVIGMQLGAFGVVVETKLSGLTDLPFSAFVLAMQPIHLAIGLVEGIITAAVVAMVIRERPGILDEAGVITAAPSNMRSILTGLLVATALVGCVASWFASTHPDGLEWALARVTGKEEIAPPQTVVHDTLAKIQETTSFLPDYNFADNNQPEPDIEDALLPVSWPDINAGATVSGLVGGLLTLLLAGVAGALLKTYKTKSNTA